MLVATGDSAMGLATIRSLGRRGIEVMCVSSDDEGIGQYSRYCNKSVRVKAKGERLVNEIIEFVRKNEISHIIAIHENLIILFNEYRTAFEQYAQLLFPNQEIFELAHYKDKTLKIAKEIGVPAPRTEFIHCFEDVQNCAQMRFPVVLKPRHRDFRLGSERLLTFKVKYVKSYSELVQEMSEFKRIGEYPLVQEYCEGHGVGIEVLMGDGLPLLLFQHRRIREYPPLGGVSVFCESVPLDRQLADYSVRLLKAMKWRGVAMVEFRRNNRTGESLLMEVNGRFWGSLPLAIQSGADFPYLLYLSSFGGTKVAADFKYDIGVKSRTITGDTKWLLAVWRKAYLPRLPATVDYLKSFRPDVRYFIWALDDPMPAIMNFVQRLLRFPREPVRRLLGWIEGRRRANRPSETADESAQDSSKFW